VPIDNQMRMKISQMICCIVMIIGFYVIMLPITNIGVLQKLKLPIFILVISAILWFIYFIYFIFLYGKLKQNEKEINSKIKKTISFFLTIISESISDINKKFFTEEEKYKAQRYVLSSKRKVLHLE
jgi:uncharacterized membrane protein